MPSSRAAARGRRPVSATSDAFPAAELKDKSNLPRQLHVFVLIISASKTALWFSAEEWVLIPCSNTASLDLPSIGRSANLCFWTGASGSPLISLSANFIFNYCCRGSLRDTMQNRIPFSSVFVRLELMLIRDLQNTRVHEHSRSFWKPCQGISKEEHWILVLWSVQLSWPVDKPLTQISPTQLS